MLGSPGGRVFQRLWTQSHWPGYRRIWFSTLCVIAIVRRRTFSSSSSVRSNVTGVSTSIRYFPFSALHGEKTGIIGVFVRKASFAIMKFVAAGTPIKSIKIASSCSVFRSGRSPSEVSPERKTFNIVRPAESLSIV